MHQRADHGALQGRETVRGEVRQVAVLGVTPHGLDGVELGCVGRQPLDDEAAVPGQPAGDAGRPVGAVPIPDEREAVGHVTAQGLEEPEDLGAADVVAIERPVEAEPAAPGRHGEGADRREPVAAIPLAEDRGLAPGRPGPAADGLQHEAALVQEDERSTGATGVFLYAATARCASAGWPPRPAPGPGAPASDSSTPPRGGASTRGRGGSGRRRCGR